MNTNWARANCSRRTFLQVAWFCLSNNTSFTAFSNLNIEVWKIYLALFDKMLMPSFEKGQKSKNLKHMWHHFQMWSLLKWQHRGTMIEMIKIDLDKKNHKTMKSKIKNLNNTQMNSQNLYSHCQRHLPHMINSPQFSPLFENARSYIHSYVWLCWICCFS